jgi:hypothetical protein
VAARINHASEIHRSYPDIMTGYFFQAETWSVGLRVSIIVSAFLSCFIPCQKIPVLAAGQKKKRKNFMGLKEEYIGSSCEEYKVARRTASYLSFTSMTSWAITNSLFVDLGLLLFCPRMTRSLVDDPRYIQPSCYRSFTVTNLVKTTGFTRPCS